MGINLQNFSTKIIICKMGNSFFVTHLKKCSNEICQHYVSGNIENKALEEQINIANSDILTKEKLIKELQNIKMKLKNLNHKFEEDYLYLIVKIKNPLDGIYKIDEIQDFVAEKLKESHKKFQKDCPQLNKKEEVDQITTIKGKDENIEETREAERLQLLNDNVFWKNRCDLLITEMQDLNIEFNNLQEAKVNLELQQELYIGTIENIKKELRKYLN